MSLAISYVNEGQDLRAYATLEKWITMTYPDIAAQINGRVQPETSNNPWSISTKIVDMFLAAARSGPAARTGGAAGQTVDADVQSGLGVLFYTNSEYARARDCFEAALSARPDVSTSSTQGFAFVADDVINRTSCCGIAWVQRWQTVDSLKRLSTHIEKRSNSGRHSLGLYITSAYHA